jgi:hypothetical protein
VRQRQGTNEELLEQNHPADGSGKATFPLGQVGWLPPSHSISLSLGPLRLQ